jgi:hypothetical protein
MTLEQWLQETLGGFPESVQRVLRQEYRAHYQDHLEAGGDPDAATLFGPPSASQKRLKKTYLTQAALERPRNSAPFLAIFTVVASMFWLWMALQQLDSPYVAWRIVASLVGLLTAAVIWVGTRRMVEARRTFIRHLGFSFLIYFEMLPNIFPTSITWYPWVIGLNMVVLLYQLFDTDRRVRRTLNPGASQRT